MQGIESVGDANAVFRLAIGGEFGLEALDLFAEDVPAGVHDTMVSRV